MSPKSGRALKEDNTVVNTAEMLEAIYNALVINKDAGITLSGSNAEIASAQDTQIATTAKEYLKAGGASQIEVYVESGYIRVRTDGQPCTSTTGEPIAAGFGAAWRAASISIFYVQESIVTVVSR